MTEPITFTIDRAQLVRYAGASGDFNPIHYNDAAAAASGLPGVLAHGMLLLALAIQAASHWAGAPDRVVAVENRFTAMVPIPGDAPTTVTLTGRYVDPSTIAVRVRVGDIEPLGDLVVTVRP